jgi:hypothetical protein
MTEDGLSLYRGGYRADLEKAANTRDDAQRYLKEPFQAHLIYIVVLCQRT